MGGVGLLAYRSTRCSSRYGRRPSPASTSPRLPERQRRFSLRWCWGASHSMVSGRCTFLSFCFWSSHPVVEHVFLLMVYRCRSADGLYRPRIVCHDCAVLALVTQRVVYQFSAVGAPARAVFAPDCPVDVRNAGLFHEPSKRILRLVTNLARRIFSPLMTILSLCVMR